MNKTWEYWVIDFDREGIQGLNQLGKEGWEAVAVYGDGMQTVVRILLKREIAEK